MYIHGTSAEGRPASSDAGPAFSRRPVTTGRVLSAGSGMTPLSRASNSHAIGKADPPVATSLWMPSMKSSSNVVSRYRQSVLIMQKLPPAVGWTDSAFTTTSRFTFRRLKPDARKMSCCCFGNYKVDKCVDSLEGCTTRRWSHSKQKRVPLYDVARFYGYQSDELQKGRVPLFIDAHFYGGCPKKRSSFPE